MSLLNSLIPAFARPAAETSAEAARESGVAAGVRPVYAVKETAEGYTLTVQLPGVAKAGLSITDEDGALTIRGERAWKQPTGWTALYRETGDRGFELSLQHDQSIDVEKIHAELADGVLSATLPKAEARKPRKIAVT